MVKKQWMFFMPEMFPALWTLGKRFAFLYLWVQSGLVSVTKLNCWNFLPSSQLSRFAKERFSDLIQVKNSPFIPPGLFFFARSFPMSVGHTDADMHVPEQPRKGWKDWPWTKTHSRGVSGTAHKASLTFSCLYVLYTSQGRWFTYASKLKAAL